MRFLSFAISSASSSESVTICLADTSLVSYSSESRESDASTPTVSVLISISSLCISSLISSFSDENLRISSSSASRRRRASSFLAKTPDSATSSVSFWAREVESASISDAFSFSCPDISVFQDSISLIFCSTEDDIIRVCSDTDSILDFSDSILGSSV